MITKPSIVQLDLDDVNDDTLAINFVVCKPLDYHQLFALPPDDGNALVYMDIYSNLATLRPTASTSRSISSLTSNTSFTESSNSSLLTTLPAFYQ
jgi:hypothetical protein